MAEPTAQPALRLPDRPLFAAAATEDLLLGARRLRQAFTQTPLLTATRNAALIRTGEAQPAAVLIRNGFAFRCCELADGRRAVLDIVVPGDIGGLEYMVLARTTNDVIAADRVGYNVLAGSALRDLMADRCVGLYALSVLAVSRWRSDRLATSLGRLDAHARICVMLLDIHDRLRHRELISRPSFNLPLTQEQMADYLWLTLVHVNRTLRRLREEKIVLIDRQVVIIRDMDRLREAAQRLPEPDALPIERGAKQAFES